MRQVVFIRDKVNKHSIRVLIAAFEKWYQNREYLVLKPEELIEKSPKNAVVLISFATGAYKFYQNLSKEIKLLRKDLNTICGGPHPSARSEDCLNLFDAVCVGEGEITLKKLIDLSDDSKCEGIFKGVVVENLDDFKVFPREMISLGPIEIIRGCPSRCAYCQTPSLFPHNLRMRSAEMVRDEIKFALSRKGYADARFIAPDASSYYFDRGVNIKAISHFLETVRETLGSNGKLFFGTFPSELDPAGVSKELVDLLVKYCDNKLIVLGLQSASMRMTKKMHRRSGLTHTEKAIDLLKEKNFEIVVDLIFGLPYEDEESYEETYNFIQKYKGVVTIHSHPFDPLPGSLWENEKPTIVPEKLIKAVKSLEGIGRVFGKVV